MQIKSITSAQWLAIAAGVASTAGALAILCSDALRTGHWSLEHALMPLIVGIAIAFGHLIGSALRERRAVSTLGFAAVFLLATVATVYNSVGRQAATADKQALTVAHANHAIEQTEADLKTSRKRLETAQFMAAWEIAGRPEKRGRMDLQGTPTAQSGCGSRCRSWKQQSSEISSHIALLESKLAGLGPVQIGSPKADRAAKVAALFGFDQAQTKTTIHLVEPFLYALLFELAAIVSFGFGFAHRGAVRLNDNIPIVPRGGRPHLIHEHPMMSELRKNGPAYSQDELATRLGISKGEVSKTVSELGNQLIVTRNGNCNSVSLADLVRRAA